MVERELFGMARHRRHDISFVERLPGQNPTRRAIRAKDNNIHSGSSFRCRATLFITCGLHTERGLTGRFWDSFVQTVSASGYRLRQPCAPWDTIRMRGRYPQATEICMCACFLEAAEAAFAAASQGRP